MEHGVCGTHHFGEGKGVGRSLDEARPGQVLVQVRRGQVCRYPNTVSHTAMTANRTLQATRDARHEERERERENLRRESQVPHGRP